MAETKKTTAKAAAKTAAAKETAVEAVKEAEAKTTAAAKKKPGRKPAASKSAQEKATAKKAEVKAAEVKIKETVHFQFSGKSYTTDDLLKICKDVWKYDLNGKEKDFKTVELYVKPEENTVYYVINGDITGSFLI